MRVLVCGVSMWADIKITFRSYRLKRTGDKNMVNVHRESKHKKTLSSSQASTVNSSGFSVAAGSRLW